MCPFHLVLVKVGAERLGVSVLLYVFRSQHTLKDPLMLHKKQLLTIGVAANDPDGMLQHLV